MIRLLLLVLALAMLAPLPFAVAQPPAAAAPAMSADQARTALDVLNDPAKRAAVAATLDAIIKAQPAAAVAPSHPAPAAETTVQGVPLPLMPDSLGAQVLVTGSDFLTRAGTRAMDALKTVQSVPLLWGWAVVMATNPIARDLLLDAGWRLAVALLCALAVEYALRRSLRRPIARLEALAPAAQPDPAESVPQGGPGDGIARAEAGETEEPSPAKRRKPTGTPLRLVPLIIARLVLQLVPVLGVAVVGHLVAGSWLGGLTVSRLVILAVIDAYAACLAILGVARMLLSPHTERLRPLNLLDSTAGYLMRWTMRLVPLAVFGYVIGEVGLIFGLSNVAHDALQKAIGLLLHIGLATMVVQKRRPVREWLRAPPEATGPIALLRNWLAAAWHWIALFILAASWLARAIELPDAFTQLLNWLLMTALILSGARLLQAGLITTLDRALHVRPETAKLYPGMEDRLHRYRQPLTASLRLLVFVIAILALLQMYGLGSYSWLLGSHLGRRVLSAVGTLTVTLVLALVVWEGVNFAVQRHLTRLQHQAQVARSARLRTLLPLLRSSLFITILVFTGLTVLSQIGVDIGPLLAGAGIVGVAIGFGSQKLVQDLITGIFLLLENAMQVGDTVTVSGLSGVVEALSVRTIRLRDGDGSVHIIPFSAVTSVTNVNRGLGNAPISVTVAFQEDTDKVAALLKDIVAGMRADPLFSARMLSDLQLWGVDRVDGASATVVGQVVCTDAGRWPVQREFNRRMKQRFQAAGIQIYNPSPLIEVTNTYTPAPGAEETPHGPAHAAD